MRCPPPSDRDLGGGPRPREASGDGLRLQRPDRLRQRRPGFHRAPRARRSSQRRTAGWSGTSTPTPFLHGDCPETVNPSLWRQGQLTAKQGLYEVTDGDLPGPRPRPLEHDPGRGRHRRHRDRPADLHRVAPPPRSPSTGEHRGDRPVTARDLHPLAPRPLRRRAGRRRRRHRRADRRARHFLEHAVAENVYAGHGHAAPRRCTMHGAAAASQGAAGPVGLGPGTRRRPAARSG